MHLDIEPGRIAQDLPWIHAPFQTRMHGVETKIILNGVACEDDGTLLANIAQVSAWYAMIKEGKTFSEISDATGISKRHIQQMLDLAFCGCRP